ncbi:ArsR/SmtB family transcription factor [Ornithinimicrobium cryptoxanthini]|uniref:ArsR/SmtB family transcription factor n=1 Tax=Ornithinimicrobium cryptoxanthini TaxID=2934161 RepID=UPI00211922EF|nr:metalloregulator ArsR/SmtB family transcription factor [Ornithinimicrobium cryptoxanthini]
MPTTAAPAASPTGTPACDAGCAPGEGLSREQADRVSALLKALADPVRLQLYSRIAAAPDQTCVCDLGDFGVSQPTVSHHLRKLRESGLIESERRGTWVYYRAVPTALEPVGVLFGR